ncbi:hypothetical protein [Rubrimonas cliftonensis]|uniref:Haemolysin XhlA n=1 Tax=Rubrimonas cliftonensis TaxID=89524 RepID=A0A1H4ERL4_9RHOB|nr:hypothetical protein [Rubrimonas cliftonensis]SEA87734.1 hypothetical protein SAMN05444370_11567 [Rubrimonas cliftonensis]
MTADESRSINDKLDAILSRMNAVENEFATLKGELRASIWQTSFQIIAIYAGAIGLTLALVRLYAG